MFNLKGHYVICFEDQDYSNDRTSIVASEFFQVELLSAFKVDNDDYAYLSYIKLFSVEVKLNEFVTLKFNSMNDQFIFLFQEEFQKNI